MKNGTQDAVLKAVTRGCRFADEISAEVKISRVQVYTHLRRLIDAGLVKSCRYKHQSGHKAYEPVSTIGVMMLTKLWK